MDEINQAYLAYAQKIADELNLGKVVGVYDSWDQTHIVETEGGLKLKVYSQKAADGIDINPDYKGEIREALKVRQLGGGLFAGTRASLYRIQKGIAEAMADKGNYNPESKDNE
jgi:hypothetical protein